MTRNLRLTILLATAMMLAAGCAQKETPSMAGLEQVQELQMLGRHAEADALAVQFGIEIGYDDRLKPTASFNEVMDAGDDPLTPGCVCCYSDNACRVISGRSVDECFPGGDGGDDLSENIAGTECVQGRACAKRKDYSCDKVLPGSVCRLKEITCCGVATTSGYCHLDIT